jgi:hypothetical protein
MVPEGTLAEGGRAAVGGAAAPRPPAPATAADPDGEPLALLPLSLQGTLGGAAPSKFTIPLGPALRMSGEDPTPVVGSPCARPLQEWLAGATTQCTWMASPSKAAPAQCCCYESGGGKDAVAMCLPSIWVVGFAKAGVVGIQVRAG